MADTEPSSVYPKITAPWLPDQVEALNAFQSRTDFHPFTCPNDDHPDAVVLTAHEDGWHCPTEGCTYRQQWAHAFMADRYCGCGSSTPLVSIDQNGRHRHQGYWQPDDEEPGGML